MRIVSQRERERERERERGGYTLFSDFILFFFSFLIERERE
jgi:hypothetical protein